MIEKVNPSHPDKVADRVAGAIVDLGYKLEDNPKIATEVLIGHGVCHVIIETSVDYSIGDIESIIKRIAGEVETDIVIVPQDKYLANNQSAEIRCGDNGIFKGVPITEEQCTLSSVARAIYSTYPSDGKYILNDDDLIICQSNCKTSDIKSLYPNAKINPLGDWTGGTDVDTGATNRKLGSDMADSVTGGGLCVSGDTEYLGEDLKWHRIDSYINGKVAQWEDGHLSFITPNAYIHNTNDKFIHFWNKTKLDMKLTPNHNVLYETSKGHLSEQKASYIADKLISKKCNMGNILHSFTLDNARVKSKYPTESMYRLQVAFCADGTILNECKQFKARIQVKKQYKIDRLNTLLRDVPHKVSNGGSPDKNGYVRFYFNPTVLNKSLYDCFYNEDWTILKDEIFRWDGDSARKIFRTTNKEDADFIQLVLSSDGSCVSITADDRVGQCRGKYKVNSICYVISPYASGVTHIRPKNPKGGINVEYIDSIEESYCFNVPSHYLILRRNNKIFVTGNCGKDLSKADVSVNIYCFCKAQETNKVVTAWCAIGDTEVTVKYGEEYTEKVPYREIVEFARQYIDNIGGFEKFAEWGLF